MCCWVHTLQLPIRDGLAERNGTNLISKIRQVVVATRKSKLKEIIKQQSGKVIVLDQATSLDSTYWMIEQFLELKPTYIDMANPQSDMLRGICRKYEKIAIPIYI